MATILTADAGQHPDDFATAVALGTVDKWSNLSTWNENDSVDTTQEEMSNIVSGIRVLPSSATVITVASSSAEDGAGTSTGALTMRLIYLDSNYDVQQEDITLNGTSNVTTAGTAIRLRQALVLTVGSAGAAVGNITVSIDGNPQTRILAGQNESRETGYTVPDGKVFLSNNAVIATGRAGNVDVDVAFEYRLFGSDVWYTLRSLQNYQQTTVFDVVGVTTLPAKTDLRVLVTATGGTGPSCYVQVRGYEVDSDAIRR